MKLILICCAFLVYLAPVYSIKCYSCTSNDADCGSGDLILLGKYKVDCDFITDDYAKINNGRRLTQCGKRTTPNGGGTIRGCVNSDAGKDRAFTEYPCGATNRISACMCTGDYCNGAGGKFERSSFFLLLISAICLALMIS